jgi:glutaredoxin-related protein
MGYPTGERDRIYRLLLEEKDPIVLVNLLHENRIKYIAVDNSLRNEDFKKTLNEMVYEDSFPKVFVDDEKKYGSLVIYEVPP